MDPLHQQLLILCLSPMVAVLAADQMADLDPLVVAVVAELKALAAEPVLKVVTAGLEAAVTAAAVPAEQRQMAEVLAVLDIFILMENIMPAVVEDLVEDIQEE
jgi:hypothetical protein